jgi:hypothetical protein
LSANQPEPSLTLEELKATAYHEAGHAVVAIQLGRPVEKVSVVRNSLRWGVCQMSQRKGGPVHDEIETQALIHLAGIVCEARYTGHWNWAGATQDLLQVKRLARYRGSSEKQVERLQKRWMDKVDYLISDEPTWDAVSQLALALVEKKSVSGRFAANLIAEILERHRRG